MLDEVIVSIYVMSFRVREQLQLKTTALSTAIAMGTFLVVFSTSACSACAVRMCREDRVGTMCVPPHLRHWKIPAGRKSNSCCAAALLCWRNVGVGSTALRNRNRKTCCATRVSGRASRFTAAHQYAGIIRPRREKKLEAPFNFRRR